MAIREEIINDGKSWSGHELNHTFINQGDGKFVDVSRLSGADSEGDGRSVALVDWDDDGSLDVILRSRSAPRVQVFRNRYGKPGNFITFELEGNGTSTNKDAIGAQITIKLEGRSMLRALRAGEGFLAQSSKRVHFGIDSATKVTSVSVRWPDGSHSQFKDLVAGTRYRIVQAEGKNGLSEIAPRNSTPQALPATPVHDNEAAQRAVLAYPLPLAELSVPSFENPKRKVRDLKGSPVLLNFWQVSCGACLVEFREFSDQAEELANTGIRIVTLNADLDQSTDSVHSMLERYNRQDSDAGYVGKLLPSMMETIERHIYGEAAVSGEVIMPTSWLLDAEGQLLAIYRGPVHPQQLFKDLAIINGGLGKQTLNALSHGIRLTNRKRKLFDLANAFRSKAAQSLGAESKDYLRMAEYFLAEDKLQRGFILNQGQFKTMRDVRYDGPPKHKGQQALQPAKSELDQH